MKLHSRIYGWKYVWMEFAEEYQASVDDPNPDSSHERMSIMVPVKDRPWTIVFTMQPAKKGGSATTTVEATFTAKADFKFALHRQKWVDGVGKLLGMQDIEIGDPEFDAEFIIKGNDEKVVKQILEPQPMRRALLDEPSLQLSASTEKDSKAPSSRALHDHNSTLTVRCQGAVDDFERLKTIYELVWAMLDQFVRAGTAKV